MVAAILAVALLSNIRAAGADVGPTNNFGSLAGTQDDTDVRLGDSRYQEYSLWPDFMSWSQSQKDFFRGMIYTGVENTFEPSDLSVSLASDDTDQDVKFVPVPSYYGDNPNAIARTYCDMASAARYGSHHHRVCDTKYVVVFQKFWENGLTGDQMVYNVLAHEFGHAVGLRHSDSPCADLSDGCVGTSATGARQWNTMPYTTPPSGHQSLMYSMALIATPSLTLYEYADLNLHY